MRWGIETSFRKLKYTLGLLSFHAKKVEHILQEIFARLIMYNFTELIISHAVIQKKDRKYAYQANFSAAVHICRQFLRGDVSPPRVEPIRGGTDGAQLSFKGLPCPNIFAGGVNFHGPHEFVSVQVMQKVVDTIVKIAEITEEYND